MISLIQGPTSGESFSLNLMRPKKLQTLLPSYQSLISWTRWATNSTAVNLTGWAQSQTYKVHDTGHMNNTCITTQARGRSTVKLANKLVKLDGLERSMQRSW